MGMNTNVESVAHTIGAHLVNFFSPSTIDHRVQDDSSSNTNVEWVRVMLPRPRSQVDGETKMNTEYEIEVRGT